MRPYELIALIVGAVFVLFAGHLVRSACQTRTFPLVALSIAIFKMTIMVWCLLLAVILGWL